MQSTLLPLNTHLLLQMFYLPARCTILYWMDPQNMPHFLNSYWMTHHGSISLAFHPLKPTPSYESHNFEIQAECS